MKLYSFTFIIILILNLKLICCVILKINKQLLQGNSKLHLLLKYK